METGRERGVRREDWKVLVKAEAMVEEWEQQWELAKVQKSVSVWEEVRVATSEEKLDSVRARAKVETRARE